MTKLLEQAIAKLRTLPPERQDEAAELLMAVVDQGPEGLQLTAAQVAEVERRLRQPGETQSHESVRELFDKARE